MPKVIEQYTGQHGCRTYIAEEQRVCMVPETKIIDGRKYCDKHAPMSEHTKGTAIPWRSVKAMNDKPPYIAGPDACDFVADMLGKDGKLDLDRMTANAELIVLAVNAHAELVEALKDIHSQLNGIEGRSYKWIRQRAEDALRKAGAL